jgi:RecA/RadA recombinase
MSQALRKLSGAIKQSNVAVVFTNQIREKVGVMYGCFSYQAPVLLADGRVEMIGHIVNNRLETEVLSYNLTTQQFEPRRILNWFDNGPAESFLRFTIDSPDGIHQFDCTPNHLLLTEYGYMPAGDLETDERLVTAVAALEVLAVGGGALPASAAGYAPLAMPIIAIEPVIPVGDTHRYDIEIEGNHCYVVDGVVVHNSPETQPGGRALKFYSSVRLDIRKTQGIKQGGDTIGNRTRVRVTKNKVAPPFRETEFDIMFYEAGISKVGEIIDLATDLNIIEKRGAFYRYKDGLLGQGRENAKQFLIENAEISDELENAIRTHFGLPPLTAALTTSSAE